MFDTCLKGVTIAWSSRMICIVSVWFGWDFVVLCTEHPDSTLPVESDTGKMLPWDGVWFRRIAREGYSYDPEKMSSVAFYQLYPMTGRIIEKITGLDINGRLSDPAVSVACLV